MPESAPDPSLVPPAEQKERLRQEARRLGFTLFGTASVAPSQTHAIYQAWLERGYAGEMGYLQRHAPLKQDVRTLLPEAQTLVALGLNYNTHPPFPNSPAQARVSRYAQGTDYHDVLRSKLNALARFARDELGICGNSRSFVDSGPVLEREVAYQAGLGWFGKHSNLIHFPQGSWFFLAELLLPVALPPDAPFTRVDCGTCTRCIEACPTQAIVADRTVDARRCISYLTIELKGTIPPELRPGIGNWVFGCDVCQEVCPWNREAPVSTASELREGAEHFPEMLVEWMRLDDPAFRERFRKTPLWRTKRRGMLRNVAVALGNWGSPEALPALAQGVQDPEPLIRQHCAWALGQVGTPEAQELLAMAREQESDPDVLQELEQAEALIRSAPRTPSAP